MDVEKLLNVISDCVHAEADYKYQQILNQILQWYTQNNMQTVGTQLKTLMDNIDVDSMTSYSSWSEKILKHLELSQFFGKGLRFEVNRLVGLPVHEIKESFQKFVADRQKQTSVLSSLKSNLEAVWFAPHYFTEEDKYEIGIRFPEDKYQNLGDVTKVLDLWNRYIGDLHRLVDKNAEWQKQKITMVSRGCLEFYIVGGIVLVSQLFTVLNAVTDFLLKIAEIRKLKQERKNLKLENKLYEKADKASEDDALKEFKDVVRKSLPQKAPDDEKTRIVVSSEKVLKLVVDWIQVEIIPPEVQDSEDKNESEDENKNNQKMEKLISAIHELDTKLDSVYSAIESSQLVLPEQIDSEIEKDISTKD